MGESKGSHLQEQVFDQTTLQRPALPQKTLGTGADSVHYCEEEFTMGYLEKERKVLPLSTAFDTDNFLVIMCKHFGLKIRQCLLNLFSAI